MSQKIDILDQLLLQVETGLCSLIYGRSKHCGDQGYVLCNLGEIWSVQQPDLKLDSSESLAHKRLVNVSRLMC